MNGTTRTVCSKGGRGHPYDVFTGYRRHCLIGYTFRNLLCLKDRNGLEVGGSGGVVEYSRCPSSVGLYVLLHQGLTVLAYRRCGRGRRVVRGSSSPSRDRTSPAFESSPVCLVSYVPHLPLWETRVSTHLCPLSFERLTSSWVSGGFLSISGVDRRPVPSFSLHPFGRPPWGRQSLPWHRSVPLHRLLLPCTSTEGLEPLRSPSQSSCVPSLSPSRGNLRRQFEPVVPPTGSST